MVQRRPGMRGAHEMNEVIRMKSDGPLILAVVFVAAGLTVIFSYGIGSAGFNAAYPLSGANLQLSIATAGPAAVGGMALVALGLLVLLWALICAFAGLFRPNVRFEDRPLRRDLLGEKRLDREEKILEREERLKAAAYPKE
jgi:hypothetical protein